MSIEDNKAAVRRLCAMLDSHNLEDLPEVMEKDFIEQVPAPHQSPGLEGFRRYMEYMYTAFPDLRWHVVDQVAEDDKVATLHAWEGTHRGSYEGIEPTDQHVRVAAMTIDYLRDGRLAESRIVMDVVSLLQQLGVTPDATNAEAAFRANSA
jgi:steroid delta-isomerase-like uncharacterized protein